MKKKQQDFDKSELYTILYYWFFFSIIQLTYSQEQVSFRCLMLKTRSLQYKDETILFKSHPMRNHLIPEGPWASKIDLCWVFGEHLYPQSRLF